MCVSALLYDELIVDEKEEVREELDINCGGITPTSLGSVKIGIMWTFWYTFLHIGFLVARQMLVEHIKLSPMWLCPCEW